MRILVDVPRQMLTLVDRRGLTQFEASVSTARNGVGERLGSQCTPRGLHVVRAKIGDGVPLRGVFIDRRFTGEIYGPELERREPGRDWVLTRILWLSGCELGRNRLGSVDTFRRFVYIHGCSDEVVGEPRSHGCIRMRNADVLKLFGLVPVGVQVRIDG